MSIFYSLYSIFLKNKKHEISTWIITILAISTIHGICTWKLYLKAGRKAWEAFVPVYNGITMMQITNRPKWWILLLFIPIINLLILPVIWIEILRTFGKKTTADMWFGVVSLGLYIGYVNYTQEVTYVEKRDTKPATKALDTLGSLSFALIVATFVHTYFIQPFVIPTSSLEKTLLVGDFLFVSKFHYGARTPITTIAAPMVHDTIPVIKTKSYLARPQLPYFRFPALQKIERNDIVVFNWPTDTLYHMYKEADKKYYKPIDKKTNYVKRCTAIPGDKLEIKNGTLFINGKESILPSRTKLQFSYKIAFDNTVPNIGSALENALIESNSTDGFGANKTSDTLYVRALTNAGAEKFKTITGVKSVEKIIATESEDGIFPDYKDEKPNLTRKMELGQHGTNLYS